jgi:hypothetical protein
LPPAPRSTRRAPAGEGGVSAEGNLLALRLLPVDLRQQQFLPVLGAVDVAPAQFYRHGQVLTTTPQEFLYQLRVPGCAQTIPAHTLVYSST